MESVTHPSTFAKGFQLIGTGTGIPRAGKSALSWAEKEKIKIPASASFSMHSTSFLGEPSASYRPPQCTRQCCEELGALELAGPREASGRARSPGRRGLSHLPHSKALWIARCKPLQCLDVFGKWGPQEPHGMCVGCRKERGSAIVPGCTGCLGLDC